MMLNSAQYLFELKGLSQKLQLAFGLTLVERMLPNYLEYIQLGNPGNYELFKHTVDRLWSFTKENAEILDVFTITAALENEIPDADSENWTNLTSNSLDLATAIIELLIFTIDKNFSHVEVAVEASIDSVYMNTSNVQSLGITHQENIRQNMSQIIVQKELEIQKETINLMINLKNDDSSVINKLYDKWHNIEGSQARSES